MGEIKLTNIKKAYGSNESRVVALNGIDFTIKEGELVVILGPSGSGKSTLLNVMGGMDSPDSGEMLFFGDDITKYNQKKLTEYRRRDIGFVFQFYNLMPNLNVIENISLSKTPNSLDLDDLIEKVGLSHRKDKFPSTLSGGEQQRVSIARALIKNPKLLLCDEPTGALDSKTGKKIIELLIDIKNKYNTTVVIVTHNANLKGIADHVITLSDGRVVEDRLNTPIGVDEIEW